jgi:hypothetical protein
LKEKKKKALILKYTLVYHVNYEIGRRR